MGIFHIFTLRFRAGDIYPPYSSLRSDPLGAKILYEALSILPGHNVKRDYDQSPRWEGNKNTTLFVLGLSASDLINPGEENYRILSGILLSGTRLVITLKPSFGLFNPEKYRNTETHEDNNEKEEDSKENSKVKKDSGKKENSYSLLETWGVDISRMENSENLFAELAENYPAVDLPASIKLPSSFYFRIPDDKWTVHYSQNDQPVIISRKFGQGTVVLCADSYILSNEAMVYDRYPALLSWLAGPARQIYFDESHFGIQKTTGIIDLVFKYRLHGVILVFLLMAALYIWKNTSRLVPPHDEESWHETVVRSERDYLDGLISLLKRNIPADKLVSACIEEWENSPSTAKSYSSSGMLKAKDLKDLTGAYKKPSQAYNAICKKLMERKQL